MRVVLGTSLSRSLVASLGGDCGTASEVARLIAERPEGTLDEKSLSFASKSALTRIAEDFVRRGWLTTMPSGWRVGPLPMPQAVVPFLEGAAVMHAIDPDKPTSIAVVTLPPSPSSIAAALPQTGLAHASLVSTGDAFEQIADAAIDNFTILTPFLNQDGLEFVLRLYERTSAKTKCLIVRQAGDACRIVQQNSTQIGALGISAFDYTIELGFGFETFHAKVGLADDELAYVGSANMTMFSRNSMELGLLSGGQAARVIANVIRAVVKVARPIPLL